jgi:hypothetical protein
LKQNFAKRKSTLRFSFPESIRLNWRQVSVIMASAMPNPLNNSGIRDNHRRDVGADFFQTKSSTSHAD